MLLLKGHVVCMYLQQFTPIKNCLGQGIAWEFCVLQLGDIVQQKVGIHLSGVQISGNNGIEYLFCIRLDLIDNPSCALFHNKNLLLRIEMKKFWYALKIISTLLPQSKFSRSIAFFWDISNQFLGTLWKMLFFRNNHTQRFRTRFT